MFAKITTTALLLASSVCALAEPPTYMGYGAERARDQARIEQEVLAMVDRASIARVARHLAARPHVAGTPAQADTRDYVLDEMRKAGLEVSTAEYEVFLPFPKTVRLERVHPGYKLLEFDEPPIAGIAATSPENPLPVSHGYAAAGDATGKVVYVNYGRIEDFKTLEAAGIKLDGCVALARYGRIYRGQKVQNAEARGAVACLVYSDPRDDGFFRGDVYPGGPMRGPRGVQRGSVKFGPPGDPTTPGEPSLPGARRIDPAESPDLPRIPSIPISYDVASDLFENLGGDEVPQGWQGGLPLRYHLGPGPVEARLVIEREDAYRKIWNTFGQVTGSEFPNERIIIGGHRDAWSAGSADNVAGSSIVVEAARICGQLARLGKRPRRTLVFATWDAEEWGIIGSAEWVEHHRAELQRELVAYLNQDMVITGASWNASASPALQSVLFDVARVIPHPDQDGRMLAELIAGKDGGRPQMGTPGGGSDHAPFFLHLGVPVASHGFGGRQGIYHSRYDTPDWMERFGDPEYRRHASNASLATALLLRLANADVIPYDHTRYGEICRAALDNLNKAAEKADVAGPLLELDTALTEFEVAAAAWQAAATPEALQNVTGARLTQINGHLQAVGPALTRWSRHEAGQRPGFYQNLVFGLAQGGGYRQLKLPGLTVAVEQGKLAGVEAEAGLLGEQLAEAARSLQSARELLVAGGD